MEVRAISNKTATYASYLLGGMLVVSALLPNGLPKYNIIVLGQLIAGVGILYRRSWSYFMVYALVAATFLTLFVPSQLPPPVFLPFSMPIAVALMDYIYLPGTLTLIVLNLLFAGALARTHRILRGSDLLDYRVSRIHKKRSAILFQVLSVLAVVLTTPIILVSILLLMKPSPGNDAGGMEGGFVCVLALMFCLPVMFLGLFGFFASNTIRRRVSRETSIEPRSEP